MKYSFFSNHLLILLISLLYGCKETNTGNSAATDGNGGLKSASRGFYAVLKPGDKRSVIASSLSEEELSNVTLKIDSAGSIWCEAGKNAIDRNFSCVAFFLEEKNSKVKPMLRVLLCEKNPGFNFNRVDFSMYNIGKPGNTEYSIYPAEAETKEITINGKQCAYFDKELAEADMEMVNQLSKAYMYKISISDRSRYGSTHHSVIEWDAEATNELINIYNILKSLEKQT